MGFKCGIVGLPNVGKSTLFNALTETAAAEAANYPFCTIEPNVGMVGVPDERLDRIAAIAKSAAIIPTQLTFVDIAGLVTGAAQGEGLGNKFLANIREVDAILHVLRCFEDTEITREQGEVDPVGDAEVVETELMLADLESLEKRIEPIRKKANSGDKESKQQVALMEPIIALLKDGKPARMLEVDKNDEAEFKKLQLLTSKPVLYVCNVEEDNAANGNALSEAVAKMAEENGCRSVVISARIEEEVSQLPAEEKKEFLEDLGLSETGLARVIREGYQLLGLRTYFTVGPKEARAWTITSGWKAPQAAGVIHTDFERGFIRAETIAFDDYVTLGGDTACKDAGKMRLEGKEYVVQDGDILMFRFNT